MNRASRTGLTSARSILVLSVWLVLFGLLLVRVSFLNDHFERISRGRQILAYGERPFADFRDPGYFLALYVSAAAQALSGGGLLGDAVVASAAIAASGVLTFWLAESASGSLLIGLIAACFTIVVSPRYYDYDKVLFYTAGLALAWRYADSPTAGRLVAAGAMTALAALFRYDNGLFVMVACVAMIALRRTRTPFQIVSDGALYVGAALVVAAPALIFIQLTAGLPEALRQVLGYGGEEARSEVFRLPRLALDRVSAVYVLIVGMVPAALLSINLGSWTRNRPPTVAEAKRSTAALLLACVGLFVLRDPIGARIGAAAPLGAVLAASVVGRWRRGEPAAGDSTQRRPGNHLVLAVIAATGIAVVLAQAGVDRLLRAPAVLHQRLVSLRAVFSQPVPETLHFVGGDHLVGLAEYLRACTGGEDRILVTWFAPEVYFFSQRGFAGGMPLVFNRHWSSDGDQRRTIDRIESQSVPVIIQRTESGGLDATTFPRLVAYVNDRYRDVGTTSFGGPPSAPQPYRVLIRRELGDLPVDPRWGVPCPSPQGPL